MHIANKQNSTLPRRFIHLTNVPGGVLGTLVSNEGIRTFIELICRCNHKEETKKQILQYNLQGNNVTKKNKEGMEGRTGKVVTEGMIL